MIPRLAQRHRVYAVDLRGFGDSGVEGPHGSAVVAEDLRQFIEHLDLGAIHVVAQDISGGTVFRLAAQNAPLLRSLTAIEMGLAGFGLEAFADVSHGGSWHIGAFATPGVPEAILGGRERDFIADWFKSMTAEAAAVSADDVDEFARTYSRPGGWRGAEGLYTSMLAEAQELRRLAEEHPLPMPTLAIGGGGGTFTATTLASVAVTQPASVGIDGVGHHVSLEAAGEVARVLIDFFTSVDAWSGPGHGRVDIDPRRVDPRTRRS